MSAEGTPRQRTLLPPFKCGHPRSDDNLKPSASGYTCRLCAQAAARRHRKASGCDRRRYLPEKFETIRRKLEALENETRELGMTELLKNVKHANREWDKIVRRAQWAAESHGGSIGFGEYRRGIDEL